MDLSLKFKSMFHTLLRKKRIRILSIDGGGIRGLIPARLVARLETLLMEKTGNPDARISDFFDFFVGTSTGGILSSFYLAPDRREGGNIRPRYSADDVVRFYLDHGARIFHKSFYAKVRTLNGFTGKRYAAHGLAEVLREKFDDLYLSRLIRPALITAFDIDEMRPFFFNTWEAKTNPDKDFLIRDVTLATSAAPTYFEPAAIRSRCSREHNLIDGAVYANNPSMCALVEAVVRFESRPHMRNIVLLSLGTGQVKSQIASEKLRNRGAIGWARPIVEIMMSGVSLSVHHEMEELFRSEGDISRYLRINPPIDYTSPSPRMDNTSSRHYDAMLRTADQFFYESRDRIDEFLKHIL